MFAHVNVPDAGSLKKRKVPGAFFSSPMSAVPTPQSLRYPLGQGLQFNARLEAVAESSHDGAEETQEEEEEDEEEEDEEQDNGEEDGEEEQDEEDGDQGRHVRFAPNTRSPIARRPVRTSLKQSDGAHQDTPGLGKKTGKKAKHKLGLLGQSNKGKGKSKASAEQIALWEKEMEDRAWGKVGGSSTIASLEEELLGAKARLKAEKQRFLADGGELSDDSDGDAEGGRDESYEIVLHPRPITPRPG
ncbi:hypothetical protein BN14_02672 [Rhizoctonia solani AG-1 IB]|uniref:Uncharacterized protein n=1 Tax=Thanatephorus cucumeris (strain AG1-IB / isolate 7/3/14) TaxID=1108050 RepID=M5BNP6_THACB|nr:hypothetical protein BN14_02672 [Rhizoctonia solani AG-1 IB]